VVSEKNRHEMREFHEWRFVKFVQFVANAFSIRNPQSAID